MKIKKKILVFGLIILVLIILFEVFLNIKYGYIKPVELKIIDNLTGFPIENIYVKQILIKETGIYAASSVYKFRELDSKSDSNGVVSFPSTFLIIYPFSIFEEEVFFINLDNDTKKRFYISVINDFYKEDYVRNNDGYFVEIIEIPHYTQGTKIPSQVLPSNVVVNLIPVVNNISDCNGNELCITKNLYHLATKN